MKTQPEALRLASELFALGYGGTCSVAAAELRRLHEVNQELLEALESTGLMWPHIEAVIAKARSAS